MKAYVICGVRLNSDILAELLRCRNDEVCRNGPFRRGRRSGDTSIHLSEVRDRGLNDSLA